MPSPGHPPLPNVGETIWVRAAVSPLLWAAGPQGEGQGRPQERRRPLGRMSLTWPVPRGVMTPWGGASSATR